MSLVELEAVEKRYGEVRALKSLSLKLEPGRIGLLGPNGAGKSTFLKSLLGLVQVDTGIVKVLGMDVARDPFGVRALIGYMPEGDMVMPELNALEYTTFAAELCGLPRAHAIARAHQVLHYVGLGEARYRKLGSYSTGMRQRARLAQALAGDPKLLLLDEPTSGLDPRGRDEMLELVADIPTRTGASVIISTHILPDVEKTCDQVLVIANGEIKYAGLLTALLNAGDGVFEVRAKNNAAAFRKKLEHAGCSVSEQGNGFEVRLPKDANSSLILSAASESDAQIRHMAPLVYTLERAFFKTLQNDATA